MSITLGKVPSCSTAELVSHARVGRFGQNTATYTHCGLTVVRQDSISQR